MATGSGTTQIGLRRVHVAIRDDDGTIQVQGSPAAGVAYNGIRAMRSRALTITPAEPVRVTAMGDDVAYYTFQESPTDTPTGELRTQSTDTDLIALITNVKNFGSPNVTMVPISTDKVGEEDAMIVWGSSKGVQSEEGSSFGRYWDTYIVLNAFLAARPPTKEMGQVGEFVWSMTCNASSVDQFGRTITEAIHGCTQAAYVIVHTRYKFMLDKFTGDGAQSTWTLSQGATTVYNTATSPVFAFVDGVQRAVSVNASGVATITPTPGNGDSIVVAYEFE
jgi:hypothetical protein